MNAITPVPVGPVVETFDFEGIKVKVFRDGKKLSFCTADVAASVGYAGVGEVTRRLKDKDKGMHILHTPGGPQRISTITEAGLYRILTQRRGSDRTPADVLAKIERFQDWVYEEVLPTIRQTGSYVLAPAQPPQQIALLGAFLDAEQIVAIIAHHAQGTLAARAALAVEETAHAETHQHLEDQVRLTKIESARAENTGRALVVANRTIEEQQPIVERHHAITNSRGGMSVTEAANIVGVSRTDLFRFLRDPDHREPWIYIRPKTTVERPYKQRCRRQELDVRLVGVQRSDGTWQQVPQTLITPKGLDVILVEYPIWALAQARKSGRDLTLFD